LEGCAANLQGFVNISFLELSCRNGLTATPIDIPIDLTKVYIQAALPQSSDLEIVWIPKLTLLNNIPLPTPNTTKTPVQTAVLVWRSKSVKRPHPAVAMIQPHQIAHRKRPMRVVMIETTIEPGRRRKRTGKMLMPLWIGTVSRTDMK
jgi:hypothetical protein